jgi:hypothetical protein
LLDQAKERAAVQRETEPRPRKPEITGGGGAPDIYALEHTENQTYQDLYEYLINAARLGDTVAILTDFYILDPEKLSQGPRALEIYRAFGLAGDLHFKGMDNPKKKKSAHIWRIRGKQFTVHFHYFKGKERGFTITENLERNDNEETDN